MIPVAIIAFVAGVLVTLTLLGALIVYDTSQARTKSQSAHTGALPVAVRSSDNRGKRHRNFANTA